MKMEAVSSWHIPDGCLDTALCTSQLKINTTGHAVSGVIETAIIKSTALGLWHCAVRRRRYAPPKHRGLSELQQNKTAFLTTKELQRSSTFGQQTAGFLLCYSWPTCGDRFGVTSHGREKPAMLPAAPTCTRTSCNEVGKCRLLSPLRYNAVLSGENQETYQRDILSRDWM
jgi:hypothetical protein